MLPFHLTLPSLPGSLFFFFNDTATTEIYTLSLHDALPISKPTHRGEARPGTANGPGRPCPDARGPSDRKSTRLNSSHGYISYAVFCLKKKKQIPESGIPAAQGYARAPGIPYCDCLSKSRSS